MAREHAMHDYNCFQFVDLCFCFSVFECVWGEGGGAQYMVYLDICSVRTFILVYFIYFLIFYCFIIHMCIQGLGLCENL
jgi:hypothetical protein